MATMTTRSQIDEFLAVGRMAVVGVARDPKEYAHRLYLDLRQWGYDAVPVNPRAASIGDQRCFPRVQDIQPGVEAALLLTPPSINGEVVRDCAQAGIRSIWLYGVGDRSADNAGAIAYCREQGIAVIPGYCPYMFLPQAPFFHKLHGFFARLTGTCPR